MTLLQSRSDGATLRKCHLLAPKASARPVRASMVCPTGPSMTTCHTPPLLLFLCCALTCQIDTCPLLCLECISPRQCMWLAPQKEVDAPLSVQSSSAHLYKIQHIARYLPVGNTQPAWFPLTALLLPEILSIRMKFKENQCISLLTGILNA